MSPTLGDHPQCQKPNHENRHKPSLYLSSTLLPENFQKGFASLSHFTSLSPTWGIECGVSPIWGGVFKKPSPSCPLPRCQGSPISDRSGFLFPPSSGQWVKPLVIEKHR